VANLIILNKTDLISKKNLNKVIANLKAINPDTEIIPTTYSKVDMKNVISIKRFDLEKAEKDVKWIMEKEKI
jgi:G3E family GTPase